MFCASGSSFLLVEIEICFHFLVYMFMLVCVGAGMTPTTLSLAAVTFDAKQDETSALFSIHCC